jgi:acyl carrier protein
MESIGERIIEVLKSVLEIDGAEINENTEMKEFGINSISFIKLIIAVEEEFGIEFDDQDLEYDKFATVASITAYVKEKMKI